MFQETLKQLVGQFDSARGAAVLNLDGLVIEAVDGAGKGCTPEDATIEYAQVFKQLIGVRDAVAIGKVQRLTIDGAEQLGLVRVLSPHYVVALSLPAGSVPSNKAHFYLRLAAPDLAREL